MFVHLGTCRKRHYKLASIVMQVPDMLTVAARGLAHHPQDHGWRHLYRLFAYGLENSACELQRILTDSYRARPTSATHLLTLLGIALQFETPIAFGHLVAEDSYERRLLILERTLFRSTAKPSVLSS
jgi:hypothetical protein